METSSADVISSAKTTFGRAASARATATRWRCPPDSSPGARAARRGVEVDQLEQARDLATPIRGGTCRRGIASAMLSPTVILGSSDENGSWNTIWSGR